MALGTIIEEITNLVLENELLKARLDETPFEAAETQVERLSEFENIMINIGKKKVIEYTINGWHFKEYAPRVYDRHKQVELLTEDDIIPFEDWLEEVNSSTLGSHVIEYLGDLGITLRQFKIGFREKLYERYTEIVEKTKEKINSAQHSSEE